MNDLISRKALLAEYDRVHVGPPGGARKLIEEAPAVQRWIPVSERLPKPYMDVITLRLDLLNEKYHAVGLEYIMLHGTENIPMWSKDHLTWKNNVTHWMPLPEPPKENE